MDQIKVIKKNKHKAGKKDFVNQESAGIEIEIHLKSAAGGAHSKTLPPNINSVIQQEYATRYLEAIGAQSTRENLEYVLQHLPLSKTSMHHLWTRDLIVIHTATNKKSVDPMEAKELSMDDGGAKTSISSFESTIKMRNTISTSQHSDEVDGSPNLTRLTSAKTVHYAPIDIAAQRMLARNSLDPNSLYKPLVNILKADTKLATTFRLLLKPPCFGHEDILNAVKVFVSSLGDYVPVIKTDKKGQLFKLVRRMLFTPSCVRLYGLLTHFCYWNIIHPAARSTMKDVILASDNNLLAQHPSHQSSVHSFSSPGSARTSSIHTPPTSASARTPSAHYRGQTPPPTSNSGFISLDSSNSQRHSVAVSFSDTIEVINATVLQQRVTLPDVLNLTSAEKNKQLQEVSTFINENIERNKLLAANLATPNVTVEKIFDASTEEYMKENNFLLGGDNDAIDDSYNNNSSSSNEGNYNVQIIDDNNPIGSGRSKDDRAIRFASDLEFEISRHSSALSPTNSHNGDVDINGEEDIDNQDDVYNSNTKLKTTNVGVGKYSVASEASLSNNEKEQLFLQLEYCLVKVFQVFGNRKMFLVAGRQAMISCCYYIVDEVMTSCYPWFASLPSDVEAAPPPVRDSPDAATMDSIKELNIRLRRLLHHGLSDFIDPTRLYTSPVLMSALIGSSKISMANPHAMGRSKYYTTSTAIKATLSDCRSDKARRFFGKSQSLHVSLPGVANNGHGIQADVSLKKKQYPDDEYVPPDGYASSAAPLNFKSLFSDQPAADYYPVSPWSRPATRPGTIPSDYEQNANTVGRILEKKIDISALPPPTRLNTAPIMGRKIKTAEKLRSFRTPRAQSSLPNVEDNRNSTESFYELFAGNDMARASSTTAGSPNLIPNPNLTSMEEESQLSNDSDARSIAFNPKSEQQLSLKAKALLMNMVVNKATTIYSKQLTTREGRSRSALLEGL